MPELSDDDRVLLDFEDSHPGSDGRKEGFIRAAFGISATRYYQRLNRLIRRPEAIAAYPILASRTIRRLDELVRKRVARQS